VGSNILGREDTMGICFFQATYTMTVYHSSPRLGHQLTKFTPSEHHLIVIYLVRISFHLSNYLNQTLSYQRCLRANSPSKQYVISYTPADKKESMLKNCTLTQTHSKVSQFVVVIIEASVASVAATGLLLANISLASHCVRVLQPHHWS
jgi:hypothetical protein